MNTAKVLLIVFGVIAATLNGCYQRRAGRADILGRAIQQRVDTLTVTVHTRDTLFRTIDRARVKYDTVWQRVRESDTVTLTRHDTAIVYVPLAAVDSTISLCRLTLFSCTQQVAARDTLIRALRDQVRWERSQRPSTFWTWIKIGLAYLAGWLSGR